jgi:hypothetical protein
MDSFDLDKSLIDLSSDSGESHWSIRHAVEGVQIFGGIGSGKTSGSGRMLALKYLAASFGGLVLTVKHDEKDLWESYCRETNRMDDLLIVEPGRDNYFNFLEYETLKAASGNPTENIVEVLKTVIRASEDKATGKSDDPFWESALDMLIFNVIDLCKLAYGDISVQVMYDIVQSIPQHKSEQPHDDNSAFYRAFDIADERIRKKIAEWEDTLTPDELIALENPGKYEQAAMNALPDFRIYRFLDQFFLETFKNLNERTRSIIDFSFSGFLFRLLRDPVFSLFCRHASTFTPEDCLSGKIILINFPVKLYHKIGRDCQIMFKYIWQRSMEKRQVGTNPRPVFLWADEAQNFLHEHDADYQATARGSRIATVYISQNLPNYYANMGGTKADSRVKSFLGTLSTKIFHANADIETNKYASELIGDAKQKDQSKTSTVAGQFSASTTTSYKIERIVRPEDFVQLKTGGPLNDFRVEGYIHCQGNALRKDTVHLKTSFNQHYTIKP